MSMSQASSDHLDIDHNQQQLSDSQVIEIILNRPTTPQEQQKQQSVSDISETSNTLMSDNQSIDSSSTCDLAAFLIGRACRNPTLANYLYWYLCIECEDHDTVRKRDARDQEMYNKVLKTLKQTLMAGMS